MLCSKIFNQDKLLPEINTLNSKLEEQVEQNENLLIALEALKDTKIILDNQYNNLKV